MRKLTDDLFVGGQLSVADVTSLAEAGFKTIICNRPDGEVPFQPKSSDLAARCEELGLTWHYIPMVGNITEESISKTQTVLEESPAPIAAFCKTGMRSAALWAAANVQRQGMASVLSQASQAGYDLSSLEPLLQSLTR